MLNVVIVDDEAPARARIRDLLEGEEDVRVVSECPSGSAAVAAVRRFHPDILFLDIRLRGSSGFDVLDEVGIEAVPAIIFTTAYDEYAVQAFDIHAVDYLLKPFDAERFARALQRAREQVTQRQTGGSDARVLALLNDLRQRQEELQQSVADGSSPYLEWLMVKSGSRMTLLEVNQIRWIEGAGNYVKLHVGANDPYYHRASLTELESKLDPAVFARIHRSTIVNLRHIDHLSRWSSGDYVVILKSREKLRLSRTYREALERRITK